MMASNPSNCRNNPDTFCYICGIYAFPRQRRNISLFVKRAYKAYFQIPLVNYTNEWTPNIVCHICEEILRQWTKGKRKGFSFGAPMKWGEPQDHSKDCYFCLVDTTGIGKKTRNKLSYPNLPSAIRPIPHNPELPHPQFDGLPLVEDDPTESMEFKNRTTNKAVTEAVPQQFSQSELNDLVRDLELTKEESEILAFRLHEKHLLHNSASVGFFKEREESFLPYFKEKKQLMFCDNVPGLFEELGIPIEYNPLEWRLFINCSKFSLKCLLLHNGNKYGPVPIGHSTLLNNNLETIMELIKYREHNWIICVDMKMINFLLGQEKGYTKFPCFICMWDSTDCENHWIQKVWPKREIPEDDVPNLVYNPVVDKIIYFPPLQIKLGLLKEYIRALNSHSECFKHLIFTFPSLSYEKIKAGIFDGAQLRRLVLDKVFVQKMNDMERNAWLSFVDVVKNFLGNKKANNYATKVSNMISTFYDLGCKMNLKIHFLFSHLDRFPEDLKGLSDERGEENFHKYLKILEERYKGTWDRHMFADYCWTIKRDTPRNEHKGKSIQLKLRP